MKYINAMKVLPQNLLNEIQKYIAGEILYKTSVSFRLVEVFCA